MSTSHATIHTIDMHTAGEPVRIVTDGYPPILGVTLLAKRRYAELHLDEWRRRLMWEPRGHADMYGVLPVTPDHPDADLAVLFIHNAGYSTMCGHAVIALGRYAADHGIVERRAPVTRVAIQCPCGLVEARVAVDEKGRSGAVEFDSVPAFVHTLDHPVEVPGVGTVSVDIAYGGAFYAIVGTDRLGVTLDAPLATLTPLASAVTRAVQATLALDHPNDNDLAFLYGTIVTDGGDGRSQASRNLCVFADAEVDRSPTGSGVTARMALALARGEVEPGQVRRFAGPTGECFEAWVSSRSTAGGRPAAVVTVRGRGYYTGRAQFSFEADDPLKDGFLLR